MTRVVETDFRSLVNAYGNTMKSSLRVLTGVNGSGKSRFLRIELDRALRRGQRCLAISSSQHDKFKGAPRSVKVLSPRKSSSSPQRVLKEAIKNSLKGDEILLRLISRILRYCDYVPEVGIRVVVGKNKRYLRREEELPGVLGNSARLDAVFSAKLLAEKYKDEIVWLAFDESRFHYSQQRNIALMLAEESALRAIGLVSNIDLYLRRGDSVISLSEASSGELSLITHLSFIATYLREDDLLLVDEPENSLHPRWQREYVNLLQQAVSYRNCKVVVATHSPLVVIGSSHLDDAQIIILMQRGGHFEEVKPLVDPGLEEVMAEVFDTITPKNHYLSQKLVACLDQLESGSLNSNDFINVLDDLESSGVDDAQRRAIALTKMMGAEASR